MTKLPRIPLTLPPPPRPDGMPVHHRLSPRHFVCLCYGRYPQKLSPNFFRKGWLQHRIEKNFSHLVVDGMDSRKMRQSVTAASFQKEKSENYRGWRLHYKLQTNKHDNINDTNNNRNDETNDNNNKNQYRQENTWFITSRSFFSFWMLLLLTSRLLRVTWNKQTRMFTVLQ